MTRQVEVFDASGSGSDTDWVAGLVASVLRAEHAAWAIHVALVDDREIHRLNREFHGQDRPTDVLSFPLAENGEGEAAWDPEGEGPAAEVVVSVDTARREASARGHEFRAELALYLIHGVLHILGYDDLDEENRERMRAAESRHLAAAGFREDLYAARFGEAGSTETEGDRR